MCVFSDCLLRTVFQYDIAYMAFIYFVSITVQLLFLQHRYLDICGDSLCTVVTTEERWVEFLDT